MWEPPEEGGQQVEATGLSRDELLKRGLVGGAALALPGWIGEGVASAAARPRRGGTFRVGMVGGGASEVISPTRALNEIDIARTRLIYERLVDFRPDGSLYNQLAEEFSPSKDARRWKIKIRKGITFHDGSPLTAADIVHSLQYIINPASKANAGSQLSFIKRQNIRKLDKYTVLIVLDDPSATLRTTLSNRGINIFKHGTTDFSRPNGTGPFRHKSFTPGARSVFVRNSHYRIHDGPYVDAVAIISIDDPTARLNALAAHQVDAIGQLDFRLAGQVKRNSKLRLLNAGSGVYTCQFVFVDDPQYSDNRVRQALRLMIDRKQIIRNALLGYGRIGNDLACWLDPDYAKAIPQRAYDPERAKSLLKQAGKDGATFELSTSDVAPGMLDSSVLIAEQAKKAGITIRLKKAPSDQYWSNYYLKYPFACTNWGYRPLDSQIAEGIESKAAPFNETHWTRPQFDKIVAQARRTIDTKKRHELWVEAQKMLWNQGGYIIWGFLNNVDATSAKVHGLKPSAVRPLGWYDFTNVYLA
jgi:peptide/nickel transport system substrate-binding protein